ncbi:rhox homeobox family member 1-like [Sigmodon hispidus]
MESKYFYFDLDYYGVGFYEEEIITESRQRAAAKASHRRFEKGVHALHALGDEDYRSHEYDHYCNHETNKMRTRENKRRQGKLEGLGKAAGGHQINKRRTKHHKFTYGQLCELDKVFQETHYPDVLQRKALAELIHVDECKVKVSRGSVGYCISDLIWDKPCLPHQER